MLLKIFTFIFCFVFPFFTWSLNLDWSGWSRVEAYYQHVKKQNYYANYHLVLQPKILVVDGLKLTGRLELQPLGESLFPPLEKGRQTGPVFIYAEDSKKRNLEFPSLFLSLSQFYLDYHSEFFKIRLGRAPYHFGMGINHFASTDPFQHWLSVYNQADMYLEYSYFYFQPAILHQQGEGLFGLARAGLSQEDWQISALYQHSFKDSSFVEAFGEYQYDNWEVQASASYVLEEENSILLALETRFEFSTKIPVQLEIKSGGAFGQSQFHPNYNVALLFWNRKMNIPNSPEELPDSNFQIANGQIQNGIYFSSSLIFSCTQEGRLKLKPLLLLAQDWQANTLNYELDIEGMYQWDDSIFVVLKGGVLYDEKPHWALLAQAAVSF